MASNWAIVIGINQYRFLQPLKYAKRDAEIVSEFLTQQARFDRIFLFTDDSPPINEKPTDPSGNNLLRVFRKIFKTPFMKDGDNFWFFFSGHGIPHNGQDYLMPSDGDPEDIERTGISTNTITNYLRSCGADNAVMILDACRNGGKRSGEGIGRQTEAEARQTGVISFFSCSPDQYSYELEAIGQGAFTHALIEGLGIRSRCATVERLNQYLENRVPNLVSQYLERVRQTPYTIAEPLNRSHLILMPQHASLADIATLKNDAYHAQTDEDWDLAEQLWIRVLAAASGQDADAVRALQKIAVKRHTGVVPTPPDEPNRQTAQKSRLPSSPPPINPTYKQERLQRTQQPTSPPSVNPAYKREIFFTSKLDEQKDEPQKGASKQSTPPKTTWAAGQQPSPPQPQSPIEPLPQVPRQRQARPIPWRALTVALLGYVITGSFLSLASASIWTGVAAGVVAVVVAWAGTGAWAVVVAGAVAVVVAVVVAGAVAPVVAGTGVGAGAVVVVVAGAATGTVAVVVAGGNLLKSFSELQTFFVLAGMVSGGLGLGWLVGAGLRLIGG